MSAPSPSHRFFRLLLHLYPRAYRARYQAEMEAFFFEERRAARGGVTFWVRLVLDHVEAAWAVRSRHRREGREGRMEGMIQEVKAAARALSRAPRFTLFAVVTLAMGIGAVSAVYTVVDRVVIRPLPYPGSERMVLVGIDPRHDPGSLGPLSPALYHALRASPGPAETVVASRTVEAVLSGDGDPERVRVSHVSSGFLETFGARPAVGRLLRPSDQAGGADAVVVLG
ncbi:MAG: ABC transporter permease, partial [Longimicrobiales bacterium]|nr:ABC transporter permease [Longimicrobiales bacterium]